MKIKLYVFLAIILISQNQVAQVLLNANGPGDTYELINAVLAPGYNVVEAPDCSHTEFGRHIDEVFDNELNINVFRFLIHTIPNNDRCINLDRQRNEIKTYDKSPDNLLGVSGEKVIYKWKFKLPTGFQSSSSFTHIHQLKSVGGLLESMPMYTLTTRKGSPDKLQLRYAETSTQITLKETDLTPFIGTWVEVTETIEYGLNGTYKIDIQKVSDGTLMFSYLNNSIVNWRADASFVRPKWGIYRSLNNPLNLRDETLLFANFSIEELVTLSVKEIELLQKNVIIYPNPSNQNVFFTNNSLYPINSIEIFDYLGSVVKVLQPESNRIIDISNLTSGIYFVVFKNNQINVGVQKLVIN
ncbi:T9SS C-terminal target domain-containing protein [Lutibacter sp. HS1-25]|uniref:T9SS type A sorting domain-containing protein n=1 Tax=Lutibacter sp. HS1-25 TaxID=2485000 RepID=UPI0010134369|nr:T9SS type A sorting domain-containing protein [Lutibacter sp. HS1-25]RXP45217.1 T9SS C-terminal target domain-containing protein [Lutibacter sp. HS1-25]